MNYPREYQLCLAKREALNKSEKLGTKFLSGRRLQAWRDLMRLLHRKQIEREEELRAQEDQQKELERKLAAHPRFAGPGQRIEIWRRAS